MAYLLEQLVEKAFGGTGTPSAGVSTAVAHVSEIALVLNPFSSHGRQLLGLDSLHDLVPTVGPHCVGRPNFLPQLLGACRAEPANPPGPYPHRWSRHRRLREGPPQQRLKVARVMPAMLPAVICSGVTAYIASSRPSTGSVAASRNGISETWGQSTKSQAQTEATKHVVCSDRGCVRALR